MGNLGRVGVGKEKGQMNPYGRVCPSRGWARSDVGGGGGGGGGEVDDEYMEPKSYLI